MTKNLLFVCLGNICSSPAAEGIFLDLIKSKGLLAQFLVDSAGTGGWHIGNPPDRRMQKAANKRGIYLPSRSRQIELDDFHKFHFILTMDTDNFTSVKSLSRDVNQPIKAKIVPILSYARSTNLTEVPDPYYGGDNGFEKVLDLLEDACEGLLEDLSAD